MATKGVGVIGSECPTVNGNAAVLSKEVTTMSAKNQLNVAEQGNLNNPAKNATICRTKRPPPTTVASDQVLPAPLTTSRQVLSVVTSSAQVLPVVATSDQVLPPVTTSSQVLPGMARTFKAGGHVNILNGVENFRESMRGFGVVNAVTRTCELGNVRAPKELWLV